MITNCAPASASIVALISPVNAPSRSQYTFCPAMVTLLLTAASTVARMAVNGGATTISTSRTSLTSARSCLM